MEFQVSKMETGWLHSVVGFATEVEILNWDWNTGMAEVKNEHQQGKVPIERLYPTKESCGDKR